MNADQKIPAWRIAGGTVLRNGAMEVGDVTLANGVIADGPAVHTLDATGLWVMPGLVDIHGDAHERQFQPRPGIDLPADMALRDSASQLLAAGITTAFMGVTLSWEPGLRSLEAWRSLQAALAAAPITAPDLRVHLRFEADNFDALDDALADIAAGRVNLLAFNDHTPGIVKKLGDDRQAAKYAARTGMTLDAFRALARTVESRRGDIPAARHRLAAAARAAGIPMASHDDATTDDRSLFRNLGASICEFPIAEPVARFARANGEPVVMGAPNVVRGGSHIGWASAAPLAEEGIVTILASDYVWPTMLEAVFVLLARGTLDLPAAWSLVSTNPAVATGLTDRGRIAPGLRGDIVVVDPTTHAIVAAFSAGRLAWVSPAAGGLLGA